MLTNYLKVTVRNIIRHKGYNFLNTLGLAIGIAVTALIMLYVQFEWGYDRFHSNADRIYRVVQRQPGNAFLGTDYYAVTQEPLGSTMKAEFPEVENYVTLSNWNDVVVNVGDKGRFDENILYATAPNIFSVFSYHFIEGDPTTALSQPNTAVLSEDVAGRFFGSADPIGKTIKVRDKYTWTVTGIFKPMPKNSQFTYGIVTSFDTYTSTLENRDDAFQWGNSSWYTYLLLRRGSNPEALQAKFPGIVKKYLSESDESWGFKEPTQFFLQPLTDIHLFNKTNFDMGQDSDIKVILILAALAFIILATACINYTNLATAHASLRAKEVGVRKVVGARRSQLIGQFMGESFTLSLSAAALALVLDEILLPSFSRLVGIDFGHDFLLRPSFIVGFVVLVLVVGLSSGAYPALVLSMFRPVHVIKGNAGKGDHPSLRNVLVVAQFAASIALIVCTLVILLQLKFIQMKNMGYNRENVVVLRLNDGSVQEHLDIMKQKLSQYQSVVSVTACSHLPINVTSETVLHVPDGPAGNKLQSYQAYADYDFLHTFDIPIVEGRNFSPLVATDTSDALIINQSLGKMLGWDHPVGKSLKHGDHTYKIIGVMKDFNLHSLRYKIHPLFLGLSGRSLQYLCIRIRPDDIPATIAHIKSVWNSIATQRPFEYTFLDADFSAMYGTEERLSDIVSYCSGLAIMIACLGLFGLAAFVVQQRRKEIGIRKVLGASVLNVVQLLSSQFLRLVLLANLVAWPVAYYLMHLWLDGFAYRIDLEFWPFIIAGAAALIIAIATVSSQALRAANANPVESLRYE